MGRMNNGTQGIYRTYEEWDNGNGKLKPHIPLSHCLIVSSIRPIRLIRLIVPYNSPHAALRLHYSAVHRMTVLSCIYRLLDYS